QPTCDRTGAGADRAHRHGTRARRCARPKAELVVWAVRKSTTTTKIEDDCRGHDRNDVTWPRPDRKPGVVPFVPPHDPVRSREAIRTSARQADRLHPIDHRRRIEQVGLARSGPATANIA